MFGKGHLKNNDEVGARSVWVGGNWRARILLRKWNLTTGGVPER